jgi:hypothetical protein
VDVKICCTKFASASRDPSPGKLMLQSLGSFDFENFCRHDCLERHFRCYQLRTGCLDPLQHETDPFRPRIRKGLLRGPSKLHLPLRSSYAKFESRFLVPASIICLRLIFYRWQRQATSVKLKKEDTTATMTMTAIN